MTRQLGFTTMTFKPALQSRALTFPELFRWGVEQGFTWVEVRDFDLDFSPERVNWIRIQAEEYGLRPHFAWDTTSFFDAEDQRRIRQGVDRASMFGDGTCSRVVIGQERISARDLKQDYNDEELSILVDHLRSAIAYAKQRAVILVFENSLETLGGFEYLLEAIPEMCMTLDTANTFDADKTGEALTWLQFRDFIIRRSTQIPYVHLKSSQKGVTVNDLLATGDVPLAELFPLLPASSWQCIELPATEDLAGTFVRMEEGMKVVREMYPK